MKTLSEEQMKFLLDIVVLHNNSYNGYVCSWPAAVGKVIRNKQYDSGDATCLNMVRSHYINWKKKQ